jgi:hypothetical protein
MPCPTTHKPQPSTGARIAITAIAGGVKPYLLWPEDTLLQRGVAR